MQVIENQSHEEHLSKKPKQADKTPLASAISPPTLSAETPLDPKKQGTADRTRPRSAQIPPASATPPAPPASAGKLREEVVNRRCRVYWKADKAWYQGTIAGYNSSEGRHLVEYDDGDQEWISLASEKFELLQGTGAPQCSAVRPCWLGDAQGVLDSSPRRLPGYALQLSMADGGSSLCGGLSRMQETVPPEAAHQG